MFFKKLRRVNIRSYLKKIGILLPIFITGGFLVVIFTPLANWLAPFFFVEPNLQKADAVVVLSGGSYPDGSLTLFTLGREIDGISLYKEGWAKKIIFVGNSGNHQVADAQKMRDLAIKLGVPGEDILVGPDSTNTYLNLQETDKIMKENNFETALLVTSSIHTKRSYLVAKKLSLDLCPASFSVDQYRQVSVDRLILFWFELRELAAMIVYRLNGWI